MRPQQTTEYDRRRSGSNKEPAEQADPRPLSTEFDRLGMSSHASAQVLRPVGQAVAWSFVASWDIDVGETIKRVDLHLRYGGRRQGGIGPSGKSPNVLIFTDPSSGQQHGYRDGWADDGTFHYTGEGQRGDQVFKQGNRAIRDHLQEGRVLRLFQGASGDVTYLGPFDLDLARPWYYDDAPETGDGPLRQVIIFRMRPASDDVQRGTVSIETSATHSTLEVADLERHLTTEFERSANVEITWGERREQPLLLRYAAYLRSLGHIVVQHQYRPDPDGRALKCDAFDETSRTLI